MKVSFKRNAFLYLEPHQKEGNKFAQCSTCKMFLVKLERCSLHGKELRITPQMSCGLYCPGGPAKESEVEHISKAFSPEESGLVNRQVRCENCTYFNGKDSCELFYSLGLNSKVEKNGCCNAQTPKMHLAANRVNRG